MKNGPYASAFGREVIRATHNFTVTNNDVWTNLLINGWFRWDTGFFLKIAASGYAQGDGSTAFAPIYPLLINVVAYVTGGNFLLAALIISNGFCLIVIALFYITARHELNDSGAAYRSVFLLLCFPTAFYLFAAYPESLFLAFLLTSWVAARNNRWLLAGVTASIATLIRFQGITIVLMLALLWYIENGLNFKELFVLGSEAVIRAYKSKDFGYILQYFQIFKPVFYIFLPIIILLVYIIWAWMNGFSIMTDSYNQYWDNPLIAPWYSMGLLVNRLRYGKLILWDYLNLAIFVLFIILAINGIRKLHPALSVYSIFTMSIIAWISLGRLLISPQTGAVLVSFMRYALTLFPLFFIMGVRTKNHARLILIGSCFLLIQSGLIYMFLNWIWVA